MCGLSYHVDVFIHEAEPENKTTISKKYISTPEPHMRIRDDTPPQVKSPQASAEHGLVGGAFFAAKVAIRGNRSQHGQ